jgi:uncharacterized membrane protein
MKKVMPTPLASQPPLQRLEQRTLRHWPVILAIALGVWVLLPFFAPVAMKAGFIATAKAIYLFYSVQCHQLPQRSYFLFGPQLTYSLEQINAAHGSDNLNPLLLRQFIGNAQMGYKVAWSDRMVSLYTSFAAGAAIYAVLRIRIASLPVLIFIILLVPIGLDGISHSVSDFWGIGNGFRDTNAWLRAMTGDLFPVSFYAGDAWGSFNAWMRLISGVVAGVGLAWFLLPRFDKWL